MEQISKIGRQQLELQTGSILIGTGVISVRCEKLMTATGYSNISITADDFSSYLKPEEAQNGWIPFFKNPLSYQGISQLTEEKKEKIKEEFKEQLKKVTTENGVLNQVTVYTVKGQRNWTFQLPFSTISSSLQKFAVHLRSGIWVKIRGIISIPFRDLFSFFIVS